MGCKTAEALMQLPSTKPEKNMPIHRDANGTIPAAVVTGFGLVLVADAACLLRLEFARTPEQLEGTREFVQLALSPVQAQALADALAATAKAGCSRPPNAVVN
jgi:hypothetical protein